MSQHQDSKARLQLAAYTEKSARAWTVGSSFEQRAAIGAYTVAHYCDLSFWVDDRDLRSKRIFMFLMIMSALSEMRAVPQVPIVTIPTN
jgi:hypothetical protein